MHECKTPFFVWFTGRTGSTFLCDLLNSHPQVYCRAEDFSEIRIDDKSQIKPGAKWIELNGAILVRRMFSPSGTVDDPSADTAVNYLHQIFSSGPHACGFKFKFPNQSTVFPEVVAALGQIENLKVIELSRANALKQAISLRNLSRVQELGVNRAGNTIQSIDLEPLVLDVPLTMAHARYFLRTRSEFQQLAAGFSAVMPVTYEQLQFDADNTSQRILEFLDVDVSAELHSEYHKITPEQLSDAVENYDELVAATTGTELEQFLDQ